MTDDPRKNAGKTRGKPFESGNPGRPKGARHRATLLAEKLMAGDAEEVVKAVVAKAKGGDMQAARIVLDRICPARRDNPVRFALPAISTAADAASAMAAVLSAVAAGELTPGEASEVAGLLEAFTRALEVSEIERRLRVLEERNASR
jgi:hypothetical protein